MEPAPAGAAFFGWSRSRPNLVGAGVAPGPRTSGAGAAQESGGSATLVFGLFCTQLGRNLGLFRTLPSHNNNWGSRREKLFSRPSFNSFSSCWIRRFIFVANPDPRKWNRPDRILFLTEDDHHTYPVLFQVQRVRVRLRSDRQRQDIHHGGRGRGQSGTGTVP